MKSAAPRRDNLAQRWQTRQRRPPSSFGEQSKRKGGRSLRFEALESRELLSTMPGHYLSGVVGSDSRLYLIEQRDFSREILAFPVAQLVTSSGEQALAPRDISCYPGYAYPGYWDKQFIDASDHPSNPLGLPSTLRSWDLSSIALAEEDTFPLPIRVVPIGSVYMDNPAYPGANQPRHLDVRLNALEWSPELPDGTRLLFGAGFAGVAGERSVRGHYLFVINQHYAKARPIVDLTQLGVESAGDIAFAPDGALYLALKGGKILVVKEWHSAQPQVAVRQLTGQWEDFDALLPGDGQSLIGIAQDGDYYRIDLQRFISEHLGTIPLGSEIFILGDNGPRVGESSTTVQAYGAFFGSRKPDDLGTVTTTAGRNAVRPYLFQRWFRFDAGASGTVRIWITQGLSDNPNARITLYQQINGGPLIPVAATGWPDNVGSQTLELVYTRVRADAPGADYTYYVKFEEFENPLSFRLRVTPGGNWPTTRLGVLGDMLSQEYAEHMLINGKGWYDLLVESGRVDGGHYSQFYPDIRWSGYEYNWANWWATSQDVLRNGQLDGIVAQAQAGLLTHVVVMLGSADYLNQAYAAIYNNAWTPSQITQFDNQRLSWLREALLRLTGTGVPVVLSTLVDPGFAPGIQAQYWQGEGRARVSQAVDEFNRRLQLLASEVGVPVIDYNGLLKAIFGSAAAPAATVWVGGVELIHGQGDGPQWTFTANGICPGSVISAFGAGLVVHALNQLYQLNLPPVTVFEALQSAGLGESYNPAGPSVAIDYSQFIYLPVLSPANNAIAGIAWVDNNRNGVRDPSEGAIGGVSVQLFSAGWDGKIGTADDRLIAEQLTSSSGHYSFNNLPAGTYYLKAAPVPGYSFTYYLAGSNSVADSDIIPLLGVSRPIELEGGILADHVDIGLCRGSVLQATSLGRVEYRGFTNRHPATGQLYYRFESIRGGVVSVNLDTVTPEAVLILTDADGNPLGYVVGTGQIDTWAHGPGQVFYAWVGGLRSLSHLAIGNLALYDSTTKQATIFGSAQRDQIRIAVEPILTVQINQLQYRGIPPEGLTSIVVRTAGDLVTISGSSSNDRANLTPGRLVAELWPDYGPLTVQVDNWDGKFEVDLGLGRDTLRMGGAPAASAEIFEFGPGGIRWRNGSFDHRIWGAEDILVVAGGGNNDSAFLLDYRGFTVTEAGATNPAATRHLVALNGLTPEGYSYRCAVRTFHRVVVDVGGEGDILNLFDSDGIEDRFFIDPLSATVTTPSGMLIKVNGAEQVRAYGGSGGVGDRVNLEGSPGNDRFEAQGELARIIWDGTPDRSAELYGFARVAVNGKSGLDEARLAIADADLPTQFWASAAEVAAWLSTSLFRYDINGFERIFAGPTDELLATTTILPHAKATLVDSAGHDFLYTICEEGAVTVLLDALLPTEQTLPGDPVGQVQIGLHHFNQITAESRHGGTDVALYISDGSEPLCFAGTPEYASVQSPSFRGRAFGFREVIMVADGDATPQRAVLHGGSDGTTAEWGPLWWREIYVDSAFRFSIGGHPGVNYYLAGLSSIRVVASGSVNGVHNQVIFDGRAGVDERISVHAATGTITYWAPSLGVNGVLISAEGFQDAIVRGNASNGDFDQVLILDSPGNDRVTASASSPRQLIFHALDHVFTFDDLAAITAVRFFGGSDTAELDHPELFDFELELIGDWQFVD